MKIVATLFLAVTLGASAFAATARAEDNADAGAKVFKRYCSACHDAAEQTNKIGPYLKGVFGRTAGTADKFHYSAAMKAAGEGGLVWDEQTLSEYLANPQKKVPGNKMPFAGLKSPDDIAAVVAFLKKESGD